MRPAVRKSGAVWTVTLDGLPIGAFRTWARAMNHATRTAASRVGIVKAPANPDVGARCGICRLGLWHPTAEHVTTDLHCDLYAACHCGRPVYTDPDGHTRGLCAHCDAVRCDAYPGECRDHTL